MMTSAGVLLNEWANKRPGERGWTVEDVMEPGHIKVALWEMRDGRQHYASETVSYNRAIETIPYRSVVESAWPSLVFVKTVIRLIETLMVESVAT